MTFQLHPRLLNRPFLWILDRSAQSRKIALGPQRHSQDPESYQRPSHVVGILEGDVAKVHS